MPDYDEMINGYKTINDAITIDDMIMFLDMLQQFGDISIEILKCKNIYDAFDKCDKIELWLLAFYNEFAHLK